MTPQRFEQINQLFLTALEAPTEQRAALVQQACADDLELRQAVERMLVNHAKADGILDQPLAAVAALALTEAEAEPEPAVLAGKRLGHYQIIRRIGAGGMGEVYLAQDLSLDRNVALKILPLEFTRDPDRLHRFAREAKAASALNHPNILTIYEIGEVDGLHFIATEYIEGETLRQRLQRGPVPVSEALDVLVQATRALNAAHQAGIIHRDLKPENLMLRPDGYLKMLDFGLARINKPTEPGQSAELSTTQRFMETHPGVVMGTPSYMSPEQARGERVDARTDLWSLGVVLYELLTGVRPFSGATIPDFMVALLEREPVPLANYLPHAPAALNELLRQLLRKDRAQRLATTQTLSQRLKELQRQVEMLEGETPTQLPDSPLRQHPGLSEAPTLAAPVRATTPHEPGAELATLRLLGNPTLPQRTPTTAGVPDEDFVKPRARRGWGWALALVLLCALAAWRWWPASPINPVAPSAAVTEAQPERTLSFYLTVQQTQNGRLAEYRTTGEAETFARSASFKLNLTSPQAGFLYLLNAEPVANGEEVLRLLFPLPSYRNASALMAAGENLQTPAYTFTDSPGTDRFLIIWGAQAIPVLEAVRGVVNQKELGQITEPAQLAAVRTFLHQHAADQLARQSDSSSQQTTVRGRGAALVIPLTLQHH
jgi:serine/threonine protein kinase